MTLAEKRLNDEILRKEILKELHFLIENYENIEEGIGDWASGKWQEFKKEGSWLGKEIGLTAKNVAQGDLSRVKEFGKAVSIAASDIKLLWEKDPRVFVQSMIDVISVFDPTGIADILNAGIYFYNKDTIMGIISALCGGLQLVGAIGTIAGGAGLPLVILGKTIKSITLFKDATKLIEICQKLVKLSDPIINAIKGLRKFKSTETIAPAIEGPIVSFFTRVKNYLSNTSMFKTFDEAFNYLFGKGVIQETSGVISSQKFKETAKAVMTGTNQAAGVGMTLSFAAESGAYEREREQKENKVRNSKLCLNNSCSTIYYDKSSKKYMDSTTGKPDIYFNLAISIA